MSVRHSSILILPKTSIAILREHIRNLHEQLTISHDDLDRLRTFLSQPLLDEPMVRGYVTKSAYTIARQKIAIEYARETLDSISMVVSIIGTHVSNADVRLKSLEDVSGKKFPKTRNGLNKLAELIEGVWELHDKVKREIDLCLGS